MKKGDRVIIRDGTEVDGESGTISIVRTDPPYIGVRLDNLVMLNYQDENLPIGFWYVSGERWLEPITN